MARQQDPNDYKAESHTRKFIDVCCEKAQEATWVVRGGYDFLSRFSSTAHNVNKFVLKAESINDRMYKPFEIVQWGGYENLESHLEVTTAHLMLFFEDLVEVKKELPFPEKANRVVEVLFTRLQGVYKIPAWLDETACEGWDGELADTRAWQAHHRHH